MSERWERELRKLGSLRAPAGTRERIEAATLGEQRPNENAPQRFLAALVATAVFVGAGAFAWRAFATSEPEKIGGGFPGGSSALVISISSGPDDEFRPEARIAYEGNGIGTCTSSWVEYSDGRGEAMESLCGPGPALEVSEGAPVVIEGIDETAVAMRPRAPTDTLGRVDLKIEVDWPANQRWEEASATFLASLRVVGSDQPPDTGERDVPTQASRALRVSCTGDVATILTPVVLAGPEGMVVEAVGMDSPTVLGMRSDATPQVSYWVTGGAQEDRVLEVAPGRIEVVCDGDGKVDAETEDRFSGEVTAQLLDPGGSYVPFIPTCTGLTNRGNRGVEGLDIADPERDLRRVLDGVLTSDTIEIASFPDGSGLWWRVVRGGRVVAGLALSPAGGGHVSGWVCADSGISISAGDQPATGDGGMAIQW